MIYNVTPVKQFQKDFNRHTFCLYAFESQEGIVIVDSPGVGEYAEVSEVVIQYLPRAFAFIYVINCANAGGVQKDRVSTLNRITDLTCWLTG